MRQLDGITDAMDTNLGKLQEMVRSGRPGALQSMGSQMVGQNWATEQVFTNCITMNTSSSTFLLDIQGSPESRKFSHS